MTADRMNGILTDFLETDQEVKTSEAKTKELKTERSRLETLLLSELDANSIERISSRGKTVYPREVLGVSADPEKREQLLEAVKAHGLDHLVTVQPSKLKTLIAEWLEDGPDAVPGEIRDCVRIYPHRRLTVRSS